MLTAGALAARTAGADPVGRVRLAWVRGEGADRCPDAPSLAREVTRRLGRDPFADDAVASIEAEVARVETRWVARLHHRSDDPSAGTDTRALVSEAADCAPIAEAVALAIAIAIDPDAALRPAPPPPAAPPPAAPPPLDRPPLPLPRRTRGGSVTLRVVGALGLLPGVAAGASVATEGPIAGRWRWGAGMLLLPLARTATPDRGQAFGLTAGWLSGCVDIVEFSAASLGTCLGVLVGVIDAVAYQGLPLQPGAYPWAGVSAAARLRARLAGPWAFEAGLELVAPLVRHDFVVGGTQATLFQQATVAGAGFAGLGVQFR